MTNFTIGLQTHAAPAGHSERQPLTLAEAHLTAWLSFGFVNSVVILFGRGAQIGTRALLAVFDFGQLLAIGALGYLLLRALGRTRGKHLLALLTLLVVVVGFGWVGQDFRGFAERHGRPELARMLGAYAALSIPGAAIFGWLLARPRLRWLPISTAALVVVANHHVLLADSRGIHLLLAWSALTLATTALVGARLPEAVTRRLDPLLARRWALLGLVPPLLGWATVSVLVLPPNAVLVQAFRAEGSVLFPFLVDFHGETQLAADSEAALRLQVHDHFMHRRDALAEIPASQPRLAPEQPIVLFITIDAVRADLLTEPTLRHRFPNFNRLAAESVSFSRARMPGSTTSNSVAQIFASKYSTQLSWAMTERLGATLEAEETPRLTERLEAGGYDTIHLATYKKLTSKHRIAGLFKQEHFVKPDVKGQTFALSQQLVDVTLALLDAPRTQPVFIYQHWLDPHDPYDAAGTEGDDKSRYVREVELCDRSLGKLLDGLNSRGMMGRTVLVVTADHGEALGEHGIPNHGKGLYESLVRVPLFVRVPGVTPSKVDVAVSGLDIAPTLLDLLGLPTPGVFMGQSLVGFLRNEDVELVRPIALDEPRTSKRGLVLGRYKVIEDRRRHTVEIYDLIADPNEQNNLFGGMPDREDQHLLGIMQAFFRAHDVGGSDALPEF